MISWKHGTRSTWVQCSFQSIYGYATLSTKIRDIKSRIIEGTEMADQTGINIKSLSLIIVRAKDKCKTDSLNNCYKPQHLINLVLEPTDAKEFLPKKKNDAKEYFPQKELLTKNITKLIILKKNKQTHT